MYTWHHQAYLLNQYFLDICFYTDKLLPSYLDMEHDAFLANLVGCSLLRFLFLLLLKLVNMVKDASEQAEMDLLKASTSLGSTYSDVTAATLVDSQYAIIKDQTCAEVDLRHEQLIKALIGMTKLCPHACYTVSCCVENSFS